MNLMSATWPALLSALVVVLAVSGSTADVASAQEPVEHGTKRADGLGITLLRDLKTDGVVQDADVALTAKKGEIIRTVKLMPMPGSYGANINLPQRGRYVVTVSVVQAGEPHRVGFDFDYR